MIMFTDLSPSQVKVLAVTGSDTDIANCARVCTNGLVAFKDYFLDENVADQLLRRLIEKGHTSPFEFAGITFSIKCPIFVARQWMRHRTFRYLERSGRYCTALNEVYLPDKLRQDEEATTLIRSLLDKYTSLIEQGMSKQEARIILPVGMYTEFAFQADLHNLLHFLRLRLHTSAQPEMRFYAQCVADKVKKHFPRTWKWFSKYYLEKSNDRKTED